MHKCFTEEGLRRACRKGTSEYAAAEVLLKGPELELPIGKSFPDNYGRVRTAVRIRWWDPDAITFRKAALGKHDELPDDAFESDYQYKSGKPVFFGHYWLTNNVDIGSGSTMCLDYSVAKKGCLVAYRWSGEKTLTRDNIVSVSA